MLAIQQCCYFGNRHPSLNPLPSGLTYLDWPRRDCFYERQPILWAIRRWTSRPFSINQASKRKTFVTVSPRIGLHPGKTNDLTNRGTIFNPSVESNTIIALCQSRLEVVDARTRLSRTKRSTSDTSKRTGTLIPQSKHCKVLTRGCTRRVRKPVLSPSGRRACC
jgi:hypothetical protein